MNVHEQIIHVAKATGDVAALGVTVATLASWLPPLSALVAIVYGLIRIYETRTVRRLLKRTDK